MMVNTFSRTVTKLDLEFHSSAAQLAIFFSPLSFLSEYYCVLVAAGEGWIQCE